MSQLLLVLHAHLPWVRGTEAESWLFEATRDCYLPLLEVLEPPITLSVSPTLAAMWADPGLRERTEAYLRASAQAEVLPGHESGSQFHRARAEAGLQRYLACGRDLAAAFRGKAELITTAATHGFLPLLAAVPEAARAQIEVGVQAHRAQFGAAPVGFWLPECGWTDELEPMLLGQGIRYVFVEARALLGAAGGVHRHVFTPAGLAAFARDPAASEQVWSAEVGYPSHAEYADFHHRLGGQRVLAVGDRSEVKQGWQPSVALARARAHAAHFIEQRALAAAGGAQVQVAPYDAELFGHWWLEGPEFLREVLALARAHPVLRLTTGSSHLQQHSTAQQWRLPFSSWGKGGDARVWLSAQNEDLWPHLHRAAEQMVALATGEPDRALTQAARELLLAQASDWPFLLEGGSQVGFARARVEDHLLAFRALTRRPVDQAVLSARETANHLFPGLDPRVYRQGR